MLRGETTRSRSKREVDLPPKRPSKGDEAGTSAGAASSSSSSKRLIFPSKHSKTHTAAPSVDSLLAHADRAQASKGKDGSAASSTPQDPFASTTRRHAPDSIFSASQDSNGSKFTSDGSSLTPPSPKKRKATTLILPSKDPSNLVFAAAGDKEVSSRAESSSGAATVPRAKLMLKLPEKGSVTANEKAAAITPPKRVQGACVGRCNTLTGAYTHAPYLACRPQDMSLLQQAHAIHSLSSPSKTPPTLARPPAQVGTNQRNRHGYKLCATRRGSGCDTAWYIPWMASNSRLVRRHYTACTRSQGDALQ